MLIDQALDTSLLYESLPCPVAFVGSAWEKSDSPTGILFSISDSGLGTVYETGDSMPPVLESTLVVELEFNPSVNGSYVRNFLPNTESVVNKATLMLTAVCSLPIPVVTYNTIHVSESGSDLNDGSIYAPVATLTRAVELASAGDHIIVHGRISLTALDISGLASLNIFADIDSVISIGILTVKDSGKYFFKNGNWAVTSVVEV